MGSRDFYTDEECRAMEARDQYGPLLDDKERTIATLNARVKRLEDERDRLRLKLDDSLDAAEQKLQPGETCQDMTVLEQVRSHVARDTLVDALEDELATHGNIEEYGELLMAALKLVIGEP